MNEVINKKVFFENLGLISYKEAWDYQTKLFDEIVSVKLSNRGLPAEDQKPTPNYLLFCQHPHVYTLGKSGDAGHLLLQEDQLKKKGIEFYHINRGGDITYHGPGQLVGYPVIDMENYFTDIHKYLRLLEEGVIQTIAEFGISGGRIDGLTGVWLNSETPEKGRKICALGVKTSRWVAMHGFALNVNADLNYFNNIVPCGISDKAVTSIEAEVGKKVNMEEVEAILKEKLTALFEMTIVQK